MGTPTVTVAGGAFAHQPPFMWLIPEPRSLRISWKLLFKSFPVEADDHFLTVCRYVERNALRTRLVKRAQDWRWCSL